jgi:SAM-dependent methyltransferase
VNDNSKFDQFASCYDEALTRGLRISGESKEYFARRRIEWLKRCLARLGGAPQTAMEFGCGSGSTVPILLELPGIQWAIGVDVSKGLLDVARKSFGSERTRFIHLSEYHPIGEIDLVYANGVFHHIAPPERDAAMRYVYRCLGPGGIFALWENNPWNPGTRLVMKRIPFDKDAITLNVFDANRLVSAVGLEIVRTDFQFIFPRALNWLRGLEAPFSRLPLGAQYQVLARKRDTANFTGGPGEVSSAAPIEPYHPHDSET